MEGRAKKPRVALASVVFGIVLTSGAAAAPCDVAESGRVMPAYDAGVAALSADRKARLDEFADVAMYRNSVGMRAQADSQGSEAANRRVPAACGEAGRAYPASKGVWPDGMEVQAQAEAFGLFGLV